MTRTEFAPPQDFIPSPENKISPNLKNFSGRSEDEYVRPLVKHALKYAKRMVVFPDLGETEPGIVPTGSVTEVDMNEHKDWLSLVKGADMGCGMILATFKSPISKEKFVMDQESLDKVRDAIAEDSQLWLGRGNHFIDFVEDDNHNMSVLIHTGAMHEGQNELTAIVEKAIIDGDWDTAYTNYMEEYAKVIKSAEENRQRILNSISKTYGEEIDILYHESHNTIEIDKENHTATIYKGAVHVKDKSKRQIMPSDSTDVIDFYLPGPAIGEDTLYGTLHGTGRKLPRSIQEEFILTQGEMSLMVPTGGEIAQSERKGNYGRSEEIEKVMLHHQLMKLDHLKSLGDTEDDIIQYRPVAYIGHVKRRKQQV